MTKISFSKMGQMLPSDLVYERQASTLANPVPAGATDFVLINWVKPTNRKGILMYALGSDQHDNSTYTWIVDDTELALSGSAKPGGIYDPLVFPEPILVERYVMLLIDNGNAVDYPNSGGAPLDQIAYEGVFIGRWL